MKNGFKTDRSQKILLLVDSMSLGGSERTVQILANNLVSFGFEVLILSLANEWEYELNQKVKASYIYKKNYSFYKKFIMLPFTFFKVRAQIVNFEADVTISFTPQSNLLSAILGRNEGFKCITSERQYAADYYGKLNVIAKPIIHWMHNRVDAVIVNDLEIGSSLKSYYKVKSPIYVLNNLFDSSILNESKSIERENDGFFRFITVGRLSKEKNTKDLLIAFSQIQNNKCILEIIGDGPLMSYLRSLAKKLNIEQRVVFRGHQKNPFRFLKRADIFVFSSLNEGFPNVILEAMACGLPIISYHFKSGIDTILEGGKNGILIELGNTEALSQAMLKMTKQPTLIEHYKQKSKDKIKEFSNKEKYINDFENIITKILRG